VEEDHPSSKGSQEIDKTTSSQEKPITDIDNLPSATGSIGGRLRRTGLGMFKPSVNKDDDSASVKARPKSLVGVFSHLPPSGMKSEPKL
jgi:Vam6/Vps39-like protein vacuolar protein sorting-associated protein 39